MCGKLLIPPSETVEHLEIINILNEEKEFLFIIHEFIALAPGGEKQAGPRVDNLRKTLYKNLKVESNDIKLVEKRFRVSRET